MKRVLIRGPLLSLSGYGHHARQIFSYFLNRKDCDITTQVLPWGITPWCVNQDKNGGINGEIMHRSCPFEGKFDISVQIQLPNEWDTSLANCNIGVTAGVETDRCSLEWATTHREKMNMVIVPSFHTRLSFLSSGTGKEKTPIVVIPESYFPELLHSPDADTFKFSTSKNFLTVGMFTSEDPETDRKNVINTVKWFCQEFDGNKDVGLIVKTSKGRETTIDRELVRKSLRHIVQKSGCKNPPKVYMLHGTMSRNEMNDLYKHPTVLGLVSATRGEGFGLPMLEAAVAGLPVVGTNWSSFTEFLNGDSFLAVECDVTVVPESRVDGKIFIKGAKWASPKESNFKRKLKKLYNDSEKHKQAAKKLSEILISSHGADALALKYNEAFAGMFK
jgi:glycosyltransferase involved in cell wall biosynthesis